MVIPLDFVPLVSGIFSLNQTIYMICNLCSTDKPEDNFQKYFHSTQNKWRIRKQCKQCYNNRKNENRNRMFKQTIIVQPEVPELQPDPSIDYSTNPDYHKCKECEKYLPKVTSFYVRAEDNRVNKNVCRQCQYKKEKAERYEYLQNNCGSDFVHAQPNNYPDEFQKSCTFDFMQSLGYLYDEQTGIWTKPGWKEIVDGKPHFLHINKKRRKGKRLTKEDKEKVSQLYNDGYSVEVISMEMGISNTTVYRYVTVKAH